MAKAAPVKQAMIATFTLAVSVTGPNVSATDCARCLVKVAACSTQISSTDRWKRQIQSEGAARWEDTAGRSTKPKSTLAEAQSGGLVWVKS